jgi:hypothetical protein
VDDGMDGPPDRRHRHSFDEIFARIAQSNILATIWREVYGEDYPQDASPFSFVTTPELIVMPTRWRYPRGSGLPTSRVATEGRACSSRD